MSYSVEKTSNPPSGSTVIPGSTVTYTVTLTSTGDVPVHDVVVTDDLFDVALTPRSGRCSPTDQGVVDYDELAGTITWDVGDVAPGATLTLSYTATIDDDAKNVVIRNVGHSPPATCRRRAARSPSGQLHHRALHARSGRWPRPPIRRAAQRSCPVRSSPTR